MSIYTQYADNVRQSTATWVRGVEVLTDNAKQTLGQFQQSTAAAVQTDPSEGLIDYLKRAVDAQGEISKRFAVLSADFSVQVLAQSEAFANAARDYAGSTQELLTEQAGKQYDEFTAARQRAEDAIRQVPVVSVVPATVKTTTRAKAAAKADTAAAAK
jgi:hypothetical protein